MPITAPPQNCTCLPAHAWLTPRSRIGCLVIAGALQEGPRKRQGDSGVGDGFCRKCKGTGYLLVQPEWMREQIAAASPPPFQVGGPLMTTPQKKGPLSVPGTPLLLE